MKGRNLSLRIVVCVVVLLGAVSAFAQPYNAWLTNSTGHSYVQLPASSSLNFAGGSFTFEAWIAMGSTSGCTTLAGNDYTQSQWIGVCDGVLRSYSRGGSSSYTIGAIPAGGNFTHVAVTFDNATKKLSHYVDGELAGERVEPGPITASTAAWRIWSDAAWQFTPQSSAIDEVRFWNVARTRDQIRATINQEIDAPQAGLVAVYELDGDATDAVGTLHGTKNGGANYLNEAITSGCSSSTSVLCVGPGGRYAVSASYKTESTSGNAKVVSFQTTDSGLFTFFSDTNWEMVVKVLNGCGVNNRWWVFSSGITDQHVELVVTDLQRGVTKRYFNYSGQPFNAITDTSAFATCP